MPKVLFLSVPTEDYMADSLFHGLRTVLGSDVVDYPKRDFLYASFPEHRRSELYGRGFTLYCRLEDPPIDRSNVWERVREADFDLVVIGDVWRGYRQFTKLLPFLDRVRAAVVDGADNQAMYPYALHYRRRLSGWVLPRAHRRVPYFKRELTARTRRWHLGGDVRPIAFSIPEDNVVDSPGSKSQQLATHVVDPEVAALRHAPTSYAFRTEAEYLGDLRASRFGVTMRKGGWEAMRHYEIAAAGTVPCFRDLDRKPHACAPHGLGADNCVVYRSADDLMRQLDGMSEDRYRSLQAGALEWARANTTRRRAEAFLADLA